MDHVHGSYESTNRFRINPFSRQIINESEIDIVIAQRDHNSERFIFELPKMVEEHDMTSCNVIRIHYINAGSSGKANKDVYEVKDLKISEDDPNMVTFSWLLSKNATLLDGVLSFSIQFACETDGVVEYGWSTFPYKSIKVPETYDNSEDIIEEDYSDILEQWKEELFASFEDFSMDDYYTKDETDIRSMQKISLVGITTLDRELFNVEIITEDYIYLTVPGTVTIDFQGYAHFRIDTSGTLLNDRLLIDGVVVDSDNNDPIIEYHGFVRDNIQISCADPSGCEHTVEFYGIPDVASKKELDDVYNKLDSKADALAGMVKLRVAHSNIIVDRELTAEEKKGQGTITLASPAKISIKKRGYIKLRVTCNNHTGYNHYLYIDDIQRGSIITGRDGDAKTITYYGYVSDTIVVRNTNMTGSNQTYTLTFDLYGIPDAIPESEIDNKINASVSNINLDKKTTAVNVIAQNYENNSEVAPSWSGVNPKMDEWAKDGITNGDDSNVITAVDGKIIAGAFGPNSAAFNGKGQATGGKAFVAGSKNVALGNNSAAFGNGTFAGGQHSLTSGNGTSALGNSSVALGGETIAGGKNSVTTGDRTKAMGTNAVSAGILTEATADNSLSIGVDTKAKAPMAVSEGYETESSGYAAHSMGGRTKAKGAYSLSGGFETIAGSDYQTVIGMGNLEDTNCKYLFIIGNGTINDDYSIKERKNAFAVDWDGNLEMAGIGIIMPDSQDPSKKYRITIENGVLKATLIQT